MQSSTIIRLAFLGVDEDTPAMVRAAINGRQFELAGLCEFDVNLNDPAQAALASLLASVRRLDAWEALLDQQQFDAVVVARLANDDLRAEQLRKLIQTGVPLLVAHPVSDSMLIYYELDMIRRETNCVVLPRLPWRHQPALEALAELVRQGTSSPIGTAGQLVVERSLASADKVSVVRQFARDVDVIRAVAGEMTRLGAMGGAVAEAAYASLGVQMSGPGGVATRWSVVPAAANDGARFSLVGTLGKATVELAGDGQVSTLEVTRQGNVERREFAAWDDAEVMLQDFARAIHGATISPDWIDAARSVELAETIDRSLLKGRTVELYYEDYTEEGTFKGTMTSLGCGLLLAAMFLLGVVAIAEQIGFPYLKLWPWLLLAVLGAFLLLQTLMLVFRRDEPRGATESFQVDDPTARR